MLFEDRRDAGRILAALVATLPDLSNAVVLALPRGGVPVAYEVAVFCNLPLDILMVRKIGAPGQRELAIGAVSSGGIVALNSGLVDAFHISATHLEMLIDREKEEIARREVIYRCGIPPVVVENRTAILIDDGLATGATMKAAVRAVRPRALRVVVAVPVGASVNCRELECEADRVLCAETPEYFQAVGQFYSNFAPTTDDEVRTLLAEARTHLKSSPAA